MLIKNNGIEIRELKSKKKDLCFAIIIGLLIHGIKFVNYLPNWDSMYGIEVSFHGMTGFGRWFSGFSTILLSSKYDLQWLEGILSVLFYAITILLILELFEIKQPFYRYLAITLFMVFPTVASTFCYMNWSVAYSFSYFLAILAVYLCARRKGKMELIISMILICLSFGIYQIYVTTAAVCFLYYFILKLLEKNLNEGIIALKRFIFAGILGGTLYLGINIIVLNITHISLGDYQGISSAGRIEIKDILYAFIRILVYGSSFYIGKKEITFYGICNVIFMVFTIGIWVKYILMTRKVPILTRALVFVCLAATILGTYLFLFVSKETAYHMVMQTGNYFVYFGVVLLLEKWKEISKKIKTVVVILLCILCIYHFMNDQIAYKQLEMSYQRSSFQMTELLVHVDEISAGTEELAIIGQIQDGEEIVKTVPNVTGASPNNFLHTPFHFKAFAKYYFGRELVLVSDDKKDDIKTTKEFMEMGIYPYGDWVRKIGDIIVIKLGNEE